MTTAVIELASHSEPWRRRLYLPAYTATEAARLCETTPLTISRWHYGFSEPKLRYESLSYLQLAELAFVATFRGMGVSLRNIRKAREYLSKRFNEPYPFVRLKLKTDGVHILKDLEEMQDDMPKLIVADKHGQEAWKQLIIVRFKQFKYEHGLAIRWFPRGRRVPIMIDPRISFGAPIITSVGVPTWIFKDRYNAGESLAEIQEDFGIELKDLRTALNFEGIQLQEAS